MAWCLIKQRLSSWHDAYLSKGYVFMAWCLIKQRLSSWHDAYLSKG